MGCSIKAWHDEEDRYEALCEKFKVKPHYTEDRYLDIYGIHATLLRKKNRGEDVDISDLAVAVEKKKRKLDIIKYEIDKKRKEIEELEKQLL